MSARVNIDLWREKSMGNQVFEAHGASLFFGLGFSYVFSSKEQPTGDRRSCNCVVFSAWSSVETVSCKPSKNVCFLPHI